MHQPSSAPDAASRLQRPRAATVFVAAFVAGAVAAFGVNRMLDAHLARSRPQVECEPIFVALRSLPQGSPVTVWDVALRDWPKAMLPPTALGADDSFEGMLLRHPLREGQPLLSVQLVHGDMHGPFPRPTAMEAAAPHAPSPQAAAAPAAEADLWTPATPLTQADPAPRAQGDLPQAQPRPAVVADPIPFVAAVPAETPPAQVVATAPPTLAATPAMEPTAGQATAAEPRTPDLASTAAPEAVVETVPVSPSQPPADGLAADAGRSSAIGDDPAAEAEAAVTDEALEAADAAPVAVLAEAAAVRPATDIPDEDLRSPAEPAKEAAMPLQAIADDATRDASASAPAVTEQPSSAVETAGDGYVPVAAANGTPSGSTAALQPLPSVAVAQPVAPSPAVPTLAAPVPTSPATDIEAPLAAMSAVQSRSPAPSTGQQASASAADSVLRGAGTAAGPAPNRPSAMRYLVVPERIALQADASFTERPPATKPAPQQQADRGQRPSAQAPQRRTAGKPAVSAGSAKPAPQGSPQRQANPQRQASGQQPRGLSGWFPGLGGGAAQSPGGRGQSAAGGR